MKRRPSRLGIGDLGSGIGVASLALWLSLFTPALAQTPATRPPEVAVAPIECWWKTNQSAVRVGERFDLTLTCAVLDTDAVKVVVDESGLAPSALHLVPFEIIGGQRFRDIRNSPRRFFQYQYSMRILGEEFFGKEISLPRLQISYRVQNSLSGGSALSGREEQYSLRPVPLRVLSLVPSNAPDIRDAPPDTFGNVDSRLFRSNLLLMVAGVAMVLSAFMIVVAIARATVTRRARAATRKRVVSPGVVLSAASRELAAVQKASQQDGWSSDLAGRAAAALRLAGSVALGRPVGQRAVDRHATPSEGQVIGGGAAGGWLGKRLVLSASVTPGTPGRNGGSPSWSALWEGIRETLAVFSAARYSRNGHADATALDSALADGQDLVKRLRRHQWMRFGRPKGRAADEASIQTWAR